MSKRVITAVVAGAALSLLGTAAASADYKPDGMTSCGVYDQALYDAEQNQVRAANALAGYRTWYRQEANDPTVSENSLAGFSDEVNKAKAIYERSKTRTDDAIAAAEAAHCGS